MCAGCEESVFRRTVGCGSEDWEVIWMCPIIRRAGLWWLCNCICMELDENIIEEKAVTSPVGRTPSASIVVAIETVKGGSTLFPQATDRETEAQGGRIRSNSLGRKKAT